MSESTEKRVQVAFVNYVDEDGRGFFKTRGQTIDTSTLTDAEAQRLEEAGAFEGQAEPEGTSAASYWDESRAQAQRMKLADMPDEQVVDPETGVEHAGPPEPVNGGTAEGTVASELTAEQINNLSGSELDDKCEEAGIDTSTGGSLQDGAMSADEKRAALKEQSENA